MTQTTEESAREISIEQELMIPPRRPWILRLIARVLFGLAVSTAMWALVWMSVGSPAHWLHTLFVPAGIVFAFGLVVFRDERRWGRPTRAMALLLPQIRAGAAPIEELSKIRPGGLDLIVPIIEQLLRDLRSQKTAVAELNHEIRQRVATRTNALERQIGTLRQQASRDALTGLFNRRLFDAYLPRIIERCAAEKIDLALLMIDVDNFKLLNDTLGHPAGDDLLRDIGQIIRSGIRDHDAPFRLGGDEFVVILPGCTPDMGLRLARRLAELVDGLAKPLKLPRPPRLSIGVAAISELKQQTADALTEEADKRLYEIKASRKDSRMALAKSA